MSLPEFRLVKPNKFDATPYVVNKRDGRRFDVYVGRPSKWGNPFSHLENSAAKFKAVSRKDAVDKYRDWLLAQPELIAAAKKELKGKILCCWCAPSLCHAEVLAEVANT